MRADNKVDLEKLASNKQPTKKGLVTSHLPLKLNTLIIIAPTDKCLIIVYAPI